jgi:hypothetical protein
MSTRTDHPTQTDPDGIRVSASARSTVARAWLIGAFAMILGAVAMFASRSRPAPPADSPRPVNVAGAPQGAPERPVKVLPHTRAAAPVAAGEETRTESTRESPAPAPAARPAAPPNGEAAANADKDKSMISALIRDVAEGLRVQGGNEGIGVYPPKGTNPPKPGIIVPDDFKLPEGYVRYHQVTDDGRRLPPILMFSPDYDFVDADGKPVAVPESGIVPPEMAPPGLPTRILEIPGESGAARK